MSTTSEQYQYGEYVAKDAITRGIFDQQHYATNDTNWSRPVTVSQYTPSAYQNSDCKYVWTLVDENYNVYHGCLSGPPNPSAAHSWNPRICTVCSAVRPPREVEVVELRVDMEDA
ncbi:hypothetical protein V866_006290 [Kwoniella sp. B9012]